MTGGDLHAETASSENGDFIRNASDRAVTGGLVLDVAEATSLKRSGDGGLLSFAELNRISLPEITLYFVFETARRDTGSKEKVTLNELPQDLCQVGVAETLAA
jgi:hypothetical protein